MDCSQVSWRLLSALLRMGDIWKDSKLWGEGGKFLWLAYSVSLVQIVAISRWHFIDFYLLWLLRSGKKLRRFSHIRLVLREIDFPTKLLEATTINQKRKWLNRLSIAREDYEKAKLEKAELAELEAKAGELEVARKKKLDEEEQK